MSNEADSGNRSNKQVLFLGPFSSFSHAASAAIFPHRSDLHPAPDFSSIFKALQRGTDFADSWASPGLVYDHAVIPVCNSTNGPVRPVIDLLKRTGNGTVLDQLSELGLPGIEELGIFSSTTTSADYGQPEIETLPTSSSSSSHEETYSDLSLAPPYTYALSVHHHLYVHPSCPIATLDSTNSLNPSAQISSLHTHPQVWTQCNRFLSQYFPMPANDNNDNKSPPSLGLEFHTSKSQFHASSTDGGSATKRVSHASTSDAAAYVASHSPTPSLPSNDDPQPQGQRERHGTRWPAVICSTLAGTAYKLKCIATSIEDDREGNQTTFIILTNSTRTQT